MAKSNYFFKHYFDEHTDEKIYKLVKNFGKEAYFHYYVLIELCGDKQEFDADGYARLDIRYLCKQLVITRQKLDHHMMAITQSQLGHVKITEQDVYVLIYKMSEILKNLKTKEKVSPDITRRLEDKKTRKLEDKKQDKKESKDSQKNIEKKVFDVIEEFRQIENTEYLANLNSDQQKKIFDKHDEDITWIDRQISALLANYNNRKKKVNDHYRTLLVWLNTAQHKYDDHPTPSDETIVRKLDNLWTFDDTKGETN